jgi:hypothetical protein
MPETQHQVPHQRAFVAFRPVQFPGAFRAGRWASLAISRAPAKVPFGEGGQAFPSVLTTKAGCT